MSENTCTIALNRSRTGLPCLWESGGGFTNTGRARLITSPTGRAKRAIYVRAHGNLCCDDHALIPVKVGDCVVTVDRYRDKVSILVKRIVAIKGDVATLKRTNAPISCDAIRAAVKKAHDYHCREPYYISQLFEAWDIPLDEDPFGLDYNIY